MPAIRPTSSGRPPLRTSSGSAASARINSPEEWIVAEVPELRIVDDELWQAAKARQGERAEKYATAIAATRNAHANRMNAAHRPRYLLSGLLEFGACGGPYSMRCQGRYGSSNHVMTASRSNSRSIRRDGPQRAGRDREEDRNEAVEAIRGLIERIVLTPGAKRGELHAALYGDLGIIIEWAGSGRAQGTGWRGSFRDSSSGKKVRSMDNSLNG